ncbi:Zn(2)-C6 fungal-specific transcription factor [Mucor lusitanicus CBS 277.49]|uniref:Zn(2)-C6 fungal-specific transcription factor n=2 Tax=Mucor circinelloides f. lusitanicus TaxID=29924 RepID=A0A162YD92_MUCCL|nr:Zn(2)-C6 fungal-specific transcription factor [Mucor lusitanicus CBS 277.49]
MATSVPKKTPCNGCRERKRKCTYGQPCERCVKNGTECTYTVMPSPKDMEYMQELEYMNQIDAIQHQIACMENEIGILKLAKENEARQADTQPKLESPPPNASDYPSPVSLGKPSPAFFDNHAHHHHRHKDKSGPLFFQDPFIDYQGLPPPPPSPPSSSSPSKVNEDPYVERFYKQKRGRKKHHHLIKSNNIQAELSLQQETSESKPWTLTVTNGNMCIETFITSHSQLMSCLGGMVSTAIYQEKTAQLPFPFNIQPTTQTTAMNKVLGILIWRKYGKSKFKSMTKHTPVLMHSAAPQQVSRVIPVEGLTTITMRLLFTYFQCQQLQHFSLYVPEFVRLFMSDDLLKSPAVMALCSNLSQQCCRHIVHILPLEATRDYALYYFEQARQLIEDKFDEISLETLVTYAFMAMYKLKTKDDAEADRYLSMAERVYTMLLPMYEYKPSSNNQEPSGESMLFSRIFRCMHHCRSVLELHEAMSSMFKIRGMGPHKLFRLLDSQDHIKIHMFPGDSPREVQFIKMRQYLCTLTQAIKDGARCAAASDFPSYIGVFGHHIEMAMRNWYRNVLPDDYQLSLPLFDDRISDLDFFTALEIECRETPIPLLTTLSLYNEYLIMAKSYVPKTPEEAKLDTEELIKKFKQMQYSTKHGLEGRQDPATSTTTASSDKHHDRSYFWLKVVEKVKYFKQFHQQQFSDQELELSDEDYLTEFIKMLNLSKINFDMPLIHTSVKSALNTVRIVQFLVSHDCACFLDLRWIMNAWEILLRAARFRYQQPDDQAVTLDRIRANLLLCLSIVKDQLDFNNRDPEGEFVEEMKQQFEELFA